MKHVLNLYIIIYHFLHSCGFELCSPISYMVLYYWNKPIRINNVREGFCVWPLLNCLFGLWSASIVSTLSLWPFQVVFICSTPCNYYWMHPVFFYTDLVLTFNYALEVNLLTAVIEDHKSTLLFCITSVIIFQCLWNDKVVHRSDVYSSLLVGCT